MKNHYSEPNFLYDNSGLSHQEILDLQNLFLTPGFHFINVQDFNTGRALVKTFLSVFAHLQEIAILTMHNHELPANSIDILMILLDRYSFTQEGMADFLLTEFYSDVLWIEAEPKLYSSIWFADIEHTLVELQVDRQIPIIVTNHSR